MEGVSQRHLSLFAAMSLVVSSMIGTGVFTSLGYQLNDIQSGFSILMLWLTGGVISLFGALCYSELGAADRNSMLTRIITFDIDLDA